MCFFWLIRLRYSWWTPREHLTVNPPSKTVLLSLHLAPWLALFRYARQKKHNVEVGRDEKFGPLSEFRLVSLVTKSAVIFSQHMKKSFSLIYFFSAEDTVPKSSVKSRPKGLPKVGNAIISTYLSRILDPSFSVVCQTLTWSKLSFILLDQTDSLAH